jgi:hypothetical protein
MGLDTSHNCWSGPYSAFNRWRRAVAKAVGIDLERMNGFWNPERNKGQKGDKPMEWDELPPRPLHILLNHSDCDGKIESKDCGAVADDLESILDKLDDRAPFQWSDYGAAQRFIKGLRAAAAAKEDVEFS